MSLLIFRSRSAYIKILFVYLLLWMGQMIACHHINSLTLLTDSYVTLYKIMEVALRALVIGIYKLWSHKMQDKLYKKRSDSCNKRQDSIRNVVKFGRTCTYQMLRLPILGSLINSLFVTALALSIIIQGIQTCVHSGHENNEDTLLDYTSLAYPIILIVLAVTHILIQMLSMLVKELEIQHGICYGNLKDKPNLDKIGSNVTLTSVKFLNNDSTLNITKEELRASATISTISESITSRTEGLKKITNGNINEKSLLDIGPTNNRLCDFLRDFSSPIAVLTCALVVLIFNSKIVTQASDAFVAIAAVALVCYSLYPSIKKSCLILLQIIPDNLNINEFKLNLHQQLPFILKIHDLHIWCLSKHKNIATCHIIFKEKPKDIFNAQSQLLSIKKVFQQFGIDHVTIQSEYEVGDSLLESTTINEIDLPKKDIAKSEDEHCLLRCCDLSELSPPIVNIHTHHHGHCHGF